MTLRAGIAASLITGCAVVEVGCGVVAWHLMSPWLAWPFWVIALDTLTSATRIVYRGDL